ncbi:MULTISPECIES: hypothetical protein [Mesorhizobium]|uniref:hypothetical protein n=1 Tax=Mesorhizobium TaxID=68287 RepID=UPI0010A96C89|nr:MULTISPECIES: hypothetical protein [Mesorhizobium]
MTVHRYSRWTFKASKLAHMETVEIEDAEVFRQSRTGGELGFRRQPEPAPWRGEASSRRADV